MSVQTENLPSGIVKFTISKKELKDILSEKYEVSVESVSFEEDVGVSISLSVHDDKEEEDFGETEEEHHEEEEISNY